MRPGAASTGAARYLLDTCVLSELVKALPDEGVLRWIEARKPHTLCTSVMTWAELQRGVARMPHSKRQSELALWLQQLESGFEGRILPFDKDAAQVWAQLTGQAQAQGKTLAAFDSIIAATALADGCALVTRNVRDFASAGVEVINPWQEE